MTFYDPYEPIRRPPEFDADDPEVNDAKSPHETAGILRMHRARWPARRVMEMFKIEEDTLLSLMRIAVADEQAARNAGRPVHDALIKRGTT